MVQRIVLFSFVLLFSCILASMDKDEPLLLNHNSDDCYRIPLTLTNETVGYANSQECIKVDVTVLKYLLQSIKANTILTNLQSLLFGLNSVEQRIENSQKRHIYISPSFVARRLMSSLSRLVAKNANGESFVARYALSKKMYTIDLSQDVIETVGTNDACVRFSGALANCINGLSYLDDLYKGIPIDEKTVIRPFKYTLLPYAREWQWPIMHHLYANKFDEISQALELSHDQDSEKMKKVLGITVDETYGEENV